MDISGDNPKLSWQICIISRKHSHAFVCQSMNQIQAADEQKGNTYEKKITIVQSLLRLPCNDENATADDNAEHLRYVVEKKVVIKTNQV